jgi:hypothetical protein
MMMRFGFGLSAGSRRHLELMMIGIFGQCHSDWRRFPFEQLAGVRQHPLGLVEAKCVQVLEGVEHAVEEPELKTIK